MLLLADFALHSCAAPLSPGQICWRALHAARCTLPPPDMLGWEGRHAVPDPSCSTQDNIFSGTSVYCRRPPSARLFTPLQAAHTAEMPVM